MKDWTTFYTLIQLWYRWSYKEASLTVYKDIYRAARLKLNSSVVTSKLSYYDENKLNGCPNQKILFTFLDKLCHWKQVMLPDMPPDLLVESFSNSYSKDHVYPK